MPSSQTPSEIVASLTAENQARATGSLTADEAIAALEAALMASLAGEG